MKRNKFLKWTLGPLVDLYIKSVEGKENIPKEPFIIVSNHSSVMDDFAILSLMVQRLKGRVGAIARFRATTKMMRERFLVRFLEIFCNYFFHVISVFEKDPVKLTTDALKNGSSMIIFPEGFYNSHKTKLLKAKSGAARIALMSKCPVLPFGIIGAENIVPPNGLYPRFKRLSLKIGKPMTFDEYYDKDMDKEMIDDVTRRIMKTIGKLCNKEYDF